MEQSKIERACDLLRQAAHELEMSSSLTQEQLRDRLRGVSERILELLHEQEPSDDPADVVAELDRKSQEIAEDLRRVERLMRDRHIYGDNVPEG